MYNKASVQKYWKILLILAKSVRRRSNKLRRTINKQNFNKNETPNSVNSCINTTTKFILQNLVDLKHAELIILFQMCLQLIYIVGGLVHQNPIPVH